MIVAVLAGVILVGYLLISRLVTEAAGFVSSPPTLWKDVEKEMNELAASLTDFYDRFPPALKENLTEIGDNLGSYISGIMNGLSEPTVNAVGNIARNIRPSSSAPSCACCPPISLWRKRRIYTPFSTGMCRSPSGRNSGSCPPD